MEESTWRPLEIRPRDIWVQSSGEGLASLLDDTERVDDMLVKNKALCSGASG